MSSITLDPVLGINPRLVNIHCFICGETKAGEIALLGASNYYDTCPHCNVRIYGGVRRGYNGKRTCPKCEHSSHDGFERTKLGDREQMDRNDICPECENHMKNGVVLISIRDDQQGEENPFRTGGWAVVKDNYIEQIVKPKELADQILRKRVCFIPDAVWNQLPLLPALPNKENEDGKTKEEG